jgi:hypothetical protein
MQVATRALCSLLERTAPNEIECFPIAIPGAKASYAILNVVSKVDCLDEKASETVKWIASDGRPDKIGQYRSVSRLIIDPNRAIGHQVFRIARWEIALIVSNTIKCALEQHEHLGVVFQRVDQSSGADG